METKNQQLYLLTAKPLIAQLLRMRWLKKVKVLKQIFRLMNR